MKLLKIAMLPYVLVVMVAALLFRTGWVHAASASTCGHWTTITSPNIGTGNNVLRGVATISANDIWAVGNYFNSSTNSDQGLAEQWDGNQWNIVPTTNPGGLGYYFSAVTAVSVNDIWAVGTYYDTSDTNKTLIEHWNGTQWNVVPSPTVAGVDPFLSAVKNEWVRLTYNLYRQHICKWEDGYLYKEIFDEKNFLSFPVLKV